MVSLHSEIQDTVSIPFPRTCPKPGPILVGEKNALKGVIGLADKHGIEMVKCYIAVFLKVQTD